MKSRISLLSMIVLAALLGVLAACTPGALTPEQSAVEPTLPADVVAPEQSTADVAAPETVTLYVGPELAECTGVAPQMCMMVKNTPDEEYTFFYNQIEGFTFEPGYEYELLVEVTPVAYPPADGSSLSYQLVEIVNQTAVDSADMPDMAMLDEAPTLESARWVLTSLLNAAGETVNAVGGPEVTAVFHDGTVGGNAGCNSYSGSYTVDGDALTVGPIASTLMACAPDNLMQQESEYLANLQAAATYAIVGSQLQIANADGAVTLMYEATKPITLTGTLWQAVNYNNGNQAVVSLLAGSSITAVFGEDGSLSGTAGCNNYTTSYTVDGEAMTIGMPAGTMMMCADPEGVMDQEAQYLAALSTTATYQLDGNNLTLRTADGAMVANYIVVPAMTKAPADVMAALGNATYPLAYDTANPSAVTLMNGELRLPGAPDSASETVVTLSGYSDFGTLESGQTAAVAVIVSTTGGSGTFYDLAVATFQDGAISAVATTFLGDRISLNEVSIVDGLIVVDMVTQGPDDPMCCGTQHVIQTYQLTGNELVLVSSEVVDPTSN